MRSCRPPDAEIVLDLSLDWARAGIHRRDDGRDGRSSLASCRRCVRRASPPMEALKAHGRGAAGDCAQPLSNGLLVAQVAVSLLLVVAAGLFVRTFERLTRVSLGFDRDRVLVVMVTAPTIPAADRNPFYHRLVRAAAAVPGVAHAGGSMNPPLTVVLIGDLVAIVPGTEPRLDASTMSQLNDMTPGWLATYGTPIRAGRDIDDHDTKAAQPVMLVNEAFVRRFFPGRNLIGTTLALIGHDPPSETSRWAQRRSSASSATRSMARSVSRYRPRSTFRWPSGTVRSCSRSFSSRCGR